MLSYVILLGIPSTWEQNYSDVAFFVDYQDVLVHYYVLMTGGLDESMVIETVF